MKKLGILAMSLLFIGSISFTSCNKGPTCPAYNSVHNSKDYGYNPNNKKRSEENNKKDIEARKKAELSGPINKKGRKAYSLFPKGMGVKSR